MPVRPKPVKISSKISSAPQRSATVAQALQRGGVVEAHAARALHQRLDDQPGDALGVPRQHQFERVAARRVRRQIGDDVLRQQAAEHVVHPGVRIAHRHRAGGVAVIAALERDELGLSAARRG